MKYAIGKILRTIPIRLNILLLYLLSLLDLDKPNKDKIKPMIHIVNDGTKELNKLAPKSVNDNIFEDTPKIIPIIFKYFINLLYISLSYKAIKVYSKQVSSL